MAIVCQISAYSQKLEDFKELCNDLNVLHFMSDYGTFIYPFEKYLYITGTRPSSVLHDDVSKERLIQVNKSHNIKFYDYENSKNHPYMSEMPENIFNQQIIWQNLYKISKCKNEYWIGTDYDFLVFKEEPDVDSITFVHCVNPYPDQYTSYMSKFHTVDNKEDYVYCTYMGFKKIKADTRKIVDSLDNKRIAEPYGKYDNSFIDDNGILWFTDRNWNVFYTFDTKIWHENSIILNKIKEQINYTGDGRISIKKTLPYNENNCLKIFLLTLDEVDSSNKTLIIRKHPDGKFDTTITYPDKFHKNKLITHTTEAGFDSIPFSDARQMLEGTNAQFHQMYKWSDNEIALCGTAYGTKQDSCMMLIYNIDTKKWNKFILPDFITPFGSTKDNLVSIAEWNNKHYFLTRDKLYAYEPIGSVETIEMEAVPDLWIRKVTPNPATNQANVNIMYYPSGIYSNDLEVGLYNYMGEKVIDLTPLGIYTEHNHTWEATFDIPKRLASGMYFLNVRSGNESRTKGIAIY